MSNWQYAGIRIYTQDLSGDADQIIARLNPLGGGTILHDFGYDDRIYKLSGLIVGFDDQEALEGYSKTATAYELISPWKSLGNYQLKHCTWKFMQTVCQTLRSDLPDTSPVFQVSLELYISND